MLCPISPKRRSNAEVRLLDQWRQHAPNHPGQFGFTLIEVLIGTILIAILVLGLSGLWTTVNNQFLFLTLKQKAIFVLNGEMERLSALYRFTNFSSLNSAFRQVNYNDEIDGDDLSISAAQRLIFTNDTTATNLVEMAVTTDILFDCPINQNDEPATTQYNAVCAGRVLVDLNGSTNVDDRNYVWIDQQRRITARLSWQIRDIKTVANAFYPNVGEPCWDELTISGSDCKELTVYLNFPFRYSTAQEPDRDAGFGRRETLVLKTFVGRR